MSAQTFHRFQELPCELRHQIWEASCFNRHEKRHGIHYVDCDRWRHYCTRIKCHPASESETSACLMDAGLWAACHESRRVIKSRMRQHGFLNTDAQNKSLCLKGPKPATLIIDQHKDIVCFRFSDWEKDRWACMFHFYLSYADSTEEGFPHKVAFEIDGIWDHQHPFWAKMRGAISFYDSDDWYPALDISIIDKNIHWFRDHSTVDETYADCHDEFTVVQWKNLCPCNQRGMWSGALAFLMYINRGYQQYTPGRCHGLYYTAYTDNVNILVRQDNEVMTCQSCQTRAQNGWHTDHLLDGMDVPIAEGDEKVEDSKEKEQESETQ